MKRIGMWNFSTRILASCAAVLLIVGVGSIVTKAGNPIIFCPMADPIAVAASPERVLVMTFCDNPRQIKQIDSRLVSQAASRTTFTSRPAWEGGPPGSFMRPRGHTSAKSALTARRSASSR